MKYLLLLSIFVGSGALAIIIEIPDHNFKTFLVDNYDSSGDGEISVLEAKAVTGLMACCCSDIADVTGIAHFTKLDEFECGHNLLTSLPELPAKYFSMIVGAGSAQIVYVVAGPVLPDPSGDPSLQLQPTPGFARFTPQSSTTLLRRQWTEIFS